jgi:hypothetical protein
MKILIGDFQTRFRFFLFFLLLVFLKMVSVGQNYIYNALFQSWMSSMAKGWVS